MNKRQPALRAMIGLAMVAGVAAGVTGPPSAVAAPVFTAPEAQTTPSVDGSDVVAQEPIPADAMEDWTPASTAVAPATATKTLSTDENPTRASGDTSARVGGLPITITPIGSRADGKARRRPAVTVGTLGQRAIKDMGLHGVALSVTTAQAQRVRFSINYTRFADLYGGDWSTRLRLVELPACALTTPQDADCQVVTPLRSTNDTRHQTVSTRLHLPATAGPALSQRNTDTTTQGAATVLAVTAAPSGPTGSFEATPLSPSATWKTNLQTGDFTWSYPMRTPPSLGGAAPPVSLGYSSGAVDGLVGSTNNQGSWVGLGFSLEPGYVERRYVPCDEDKATTPAGNPNNADLTRYDLCWRSDNATMMFGGHATPLVRVGPASDQWRMQQDDGSRIERRTVNGEQSWVLTTRDGTRYFFGAEDTGTDSVWSVPVFGNHPGEPGHDTTFATSWGHQPWRWNLDKVIDPAGNAVHYFYSSEQNNYGRNDNSAVATYDRAGFLTRIEYGKASSRSTSQHQRTGTRPASRVG
jgi:hypothetical protein